MRLSKPLFGQQRVVDQWKSAYNVQVDIAGVTCDGCTSASGRWGVHCAECPDYACQKLSSFYQY